MATLSITEFRETGIYSEDLGLNIPGQDLEGCAGRVYLNALHIEHWKDARHGNAPTDGPTWLLNLGNAQHQGDLAELELELYRWAMTDGSLVRENDPSGVSREFPEFSAFDIPLPLLEAEWTDASWHHDAMPFFVHTPSGVGVWVNYADPAQREVPDRFIAVALEWDRATSSWMHDTKGSLPVLFTTDDEATLIASLTNFVQARSLAHKFALSVEDLGEEKLAEIRRRNATPPYAAACASHDFVDANILMAEAFQDVLHRPFLPEDNTEPPQDDIALWNLAWEIARTERLRAEP
ncbi:hypothetical protein [Sphingomonas sp. 3-13AW]|uniref:hypothetical protein n=1 Tax=Sphingomonas sp. 3-13AW TaxID=3050450 RepID=UPI003BB5038D